MERTRILNSCSTLSSIISRLLKNRLAISQEATTTKTKSHSKLKTLNSQMGIATGKSRRSRMVRSRMEHKKVIVNPKNFKIPKKTLESQKPIR